MQRVKKLFDLLPYYQDCFGDKNILNAKKDGQWIGLKVSELERLSNELAALLRKDGVSGEGGVETRDKVSIISSNRPEWVITDFAVQKLGAILVPIYPSISKAELQYVLNEAGTKVLFIEDKVLYNKIKDILPNLPALVKVYAYDAIEGVTKWDQDLQPLSTDDKLQLEKSKNQVSPEDVFTLIYTSGTTGNPKGVMLTHKNLLSNVLNSIHCFSMCDASSSVLSFLPLNHIFERMVTYLYIFKGVSIYYAEGMETIGDNLKEVKPAVFTTVPRLLEKVFERIEQKGGKLEGFQKKVFDWAMNLALKFDPDTSSSILYKAQLMLADKLVFSKWREALGGNVKAIVTGSAACQVKLLRVFTAAKLIVMEGYGLTESSPVISVNTYEQTGRKFGTVGVLIKNVDVKIASDGEILFKGDNVMVGYYKNEAATQEMIQDGWLHTGDIGSYSDDGFLKITDRKKELFKISGGKYIAPLPLENKMKESPFIEQIMVVGNNEKFVGALIVPSLFNIKEYFSRIGASIADGLDITADQDVIKLIRNELNKFNKEFATHEHVKRFQLVENEWTIEGGELTPKLSLKRRKIEEKYGHLLNKIYNN